MGTILPSILGLKRIVLCQNAQKIAQTMEISTSNFFFFLETWGLDYVFIMSTVTL